MPPTEFFRLLQGVIAVVVLQVPGDEARRGV